MSTETKNKIVPELRFPEFKNAGEWKERQLGEIGEFIGGGTPDTSNPEYWEGAIQWFTPTEIKERNISKSIRTITEKGLQNSSAKLLPVGALLITTRATIGDVGIATDECSTNQGFQSLVVNDDEVNIFWYYWIIQNKNELVRKASGSTFKEIGKTEIVKIKTFRPEKDEQQKIADCLSSLDELITAHNQKLEALQAHKKGLMQQLFPGEGETVPRLRFEEFQSSEIWKINPLSKFIASLDAGVSVNSGDRSAGKNEVGILKTSCVANGVFDYTENKVVENAVEIERLREPIRGDTIVISRMNTPILVGANAYVDDDIENIFLPDRLWAAKPKANINMRFISYVLGSIQGRKKLTELATGTSGSMKNISKSSVLEILISAPDLLEQQKIADCLSSLDELINAQTDKIEVLQKHKKGLMQGLFPASANVNEFNKSITKNE